MNIFGHNKNRTLCQGHAEKLLVTSLYTILCQHNEV